MRLLPWLLLAAALAYPLLAQSSMGSISTLRGPVKILGQPAASDWIYVESNEVGGAATQYVVPSGHVFVLKHLVVHGLGPSQKLRAQVSVDGKLVTQVDIVDPPVEAPFRPIQLVSNFCPQEDHAFEIAGEGQLIEVARIDAGGPGWLPDEFTVLLRGWLEDIQ